MPTLFLAERRFGSSDQTWFAAVSGDCNPMHMDALAARRTMAGFPVVHGIHTLLWALDSLFRVVPNLPACASIKANFESMVYVGDRARATLIDQDDKHATVAIAVEGTAVMEIEIAFGPLGTATVLPRGNAYRPERPLDLRFEEIETMAGHVPVPDAAAALLEAFPAASAAFGAERIAGLACSSFLVGMVCPGLHSIYRNLTLALTPAQADALCFRVRYAAADYRFVRLAVSGAGWSGQIDTNVRPEPAAQAGLADLANRVVANEFAGISALILGGSRGLGELTANILAAGGAHVMLTYAMGEADARRVQADIIAGGGRCDVVHYDVGKPASDQVGNLPRLPDQLYYMATPKIFRRQEAVFSAANFQEFLTFYVTAFADLCNELRARASSEISVFYPSSVSIDDRPANMTEYTMAKAAGEVLCADMTSFGRWQRLLVRRLPRLPTDQTATLFEADDADPVETMLPIVREMRITP